MADRKGQPAGQPTPKHSHDAATLADCRLCAIYRHPGQAAAHLKTNPLPRQAVAGA